MDSYILNGEIRGSGTYLHSSRSAGVSLAKGYGAVRFPKRWTVLANGVGAIPVVTLPLAYPGYP
jgi:hypothetical protein